MVENRDGFIDDEWGELEKVLEGLREAVENETLEDRYGMDATELVNYVENNLVMTDEDVEKVRDEIEGKKCPYCVTENRALSGGEFEERVDPTLETYVWSKTDDGFRDDSGEKITASYAVKCGNGHDDMFMLYEESWYADE